VTLLEGQKRWILFPPSVPPELIGMVEPPIPSVIWFHRYYDKVISSLQTSPEQQWKPVEILQQPGETVFVPNGWAHAVVNLSPTNVAITHNYASEYSLERVWRQAMTEEPEFANKWYMTMQQKRPDLAQKIRVASG
jgi:histone arginine demethylase JMJD6